MKVTMRDNLRFFASEDTDFNISKGEEKILPEKTLKSYSIKYHLFNGNFRVTEGECLINIKHSKVLFSAETHPLCYGTEFGKFFKKDLETQQLFWIDKDEITNLNPAIYDKLVEDNPIIDLKEEVQEVQEVQEQPDDGELEDIASKEDEKYTKTDIYNMSKSEQIKLLEEFGLSKKEIKELRIEENRVDKILELQ